MPDSKNRIFSKRASPGVCEKLYRLSLTGNAINIPKNQYFEFMRYFQLSLISWFRFLLLKQMFRACMSYLRSVLIISLSYGMFTDSLSANPADVQKNPSERKSLLNGRIWHNQYTRAVGDQFFLSGTFLKGSVSVSGRNFDNLDLLYDLANDELILRVESYPVIIMNKEMVDSFNLVFGNRTYHVINAGNDTACVLRGYVNVLYQGLSSLYVKYSKKLQPLAVDGRFDLFYQEQDVYLKRGEEIIPVAGKKKLLDLLDDRKKEISDYLKSNRLNFKLRDKDPGTYVTLLKFYDSLSE